MSSPLTLSVKMSAVAISPSYLEDLASEYYGRVLHLAGGGESEETVIEFADSTHEVLKVPIVASVNLAQFKSALDSFLIHQT